MILKNEGGESDRIFWEKHNQRHLRSAPDFSGGKSIMTLSGFSMPPEISHNRAMEIIAEYLTISGEQRVKAQLQFEEMMISREMPIEMAFKAAIVNKKA